MSWDMYPDSAVDYLLEKGKPMDNETCIICGKEVLTMSFQGTGVCGENHRKIRDGEEPPLRAQVDAGEPPAFYMSNEASKVRPGEIT